MVRRDRNACDSFEVLRANIVRVEEFFIFFHICVSEDRDSVISDLTVLTFLFVVEEESSEFTGA
jgi:hypothetical protein